MASKGLTVAAIVFLLLSIAVFGYFAGQRVANFQCSSSSFSTTTPAVNISFNTTAAVIFYGSLMSPLGLFTDYPGSHQTNSNAREPVARGRAQTRAIRFGA